MSEVTKLYENVGIKLGCCKYAEYGYEGEEGTWYYCKKEGKGCWTYPNGDADCVEKGYPPFTAEKQIELIKWLKDNRNFHTCGNWCTSLDSTGETIEHRDSKFEEALAGLINQLFTAQDLTEEEKQQVKGILE